MATQIETTYCVVVRTEPLVVLGPFDSRDAAGKYVADRRAENPFVPLFVDVLHVPPATKDAPAAPAEEEESK